MGGGRKRHGVSIGPMVQKDHKQSGIIRPETRQKVYGLDPDRIAAKPLSGNRKDAERVRLVKDFFSDQPEEYIIYQELTEEVTHDLTTNRRFTILTHAIPDNRTFIVDNVEFFARSAFNAGLIEAGIVEGALQCFFEIGEVVPVEISTTRVQPTLPAENRAYFPFLNDRIGAREVTFSLFAKSGRELTAYYINRVIPPVPIATVGVRIEGWLIDSNVVEEILEQQR